MFAFRFFTRCAFMVMNSLTGLLSIILLKYILITMYFFDFIMLFSTLRTDIKNARFLILTCDNIFFKYLQSINIIKHSVFKHTSDIFFKILFYVTDKVEYLHLQNLYSEDLA